MNKERLEEIENKLLQATNEDDEDVVYASICAEAVLEDLQWTVGYAKEQAERVQELENIIYQDERQAVLEGMYEQNKRYQEALEFYAKGNHYYAEGYPNTTLKATDYGEVARKALEE